MKKTPVWLTLILLLWTGAHARENFNVESFGAQQEPGQSAAATVETPELKEAAAQTNAAAGFYRAGKFDDALAATTRALELREKALPKHHALINVSLNNLGRIYLAQENYSEALKIFLRLKDTYDQTLPPRHEHYDALHRSLSTIYASLGRDSEAEESLQQLLVLRETLHGADHAQVAPALLALASFYQLRGRETQAEQLYARAIAILEKQKDIDQTFYLTALERYACVLRKTDKEREAEEIKTRAREIIGKQYDSARAQSIEGGVLNGKAISKPSPGYPPDAKALRVAGTVVVHVLVDETGRVLQACAMSGPPLLRAASERAAYAARFTPTLLGGKPVKVTGVISYNYVL